MLKDEFYTVMIGNEYTYVAGNKGIATSTTPRKTMTVRGEGAVEKLKDKISKAKSSYHSKSKMKIVKVTVEEINE